MILLEDMGWETEIWKSRSESERGHCDMRYT